MNGAVRLNATRVVRLTEADWREFAALRLRALRDTLGTDDPQYRTEVAFTAARWRRRLRAHAQFVVMAGDRMVGLVGAQRENADSVYLYSLWLEPSARRRGHASELLSAAVTWARGERVRSVTLRVEVDNAAARSVYEALGFALAPSTSKGRADEVTMRLDVS